MTEQKINIPTPKTKICRKCQKEIPIEQLVKNNLCKDGYLRRCKPCHNKISAAYVLNNPEKRKQTLQNDYQANKARFLKNARNWRKTNPEKVREKSKQQYAENPEYYKNYAKTVGVKKYQAKYPEKYKAHSKVHNAVRDGKLPRVSTLKCVSCGNQATQYHHHAGYEEKNWLNVIPMCKPCHSKEHRIHL